MENSKKVGDLLVLTINYAKSDQFPIFCTFLFSETAQPIVKYQNLHDRVIGKIEDLLKQKLSEGGENEEGWCERRVETLKKFWNMRLSGYKRDVKVWHNQSWPLKRKVFLNNGLLFLTPAIGSTKDCCQ